ncbi:hypothetical protein EJ06DRAFT_478778 [Trichodelitschia bisporula]|uniref:Hemerythrin-like domain-containing protein n=1 Tax=Trichodelitschia bisporula TaxID=703511 RepID=A0A6G1HSJ3_9PEZI|nr:hypothetical protein EJ06DRAFT_478778 [Trichodelitschia bisporula]
MSPRPWADTPFPLIPTPRPTSTDKSGKQHFSVRMAQEMVYIHNAVLRCLNAIYNQAPYVSTPTDIRDLLQLIAHWLYELHHHHTTEEDMFFPRVEEITGNTGVMSGNVEQHEAFEPGLAALEAYVKTTTPETYDGSKLQAIIDSFGEILQTHLSDEITTLLSLAPYPNDELQKAWTDTSAWVLRTCDRTVQTPILMGCSDRTYEGGLGPALPFPVFLPPLVHFWYERRWAKAWRFLPCTTYGEPRPLAFGPPEQKMVK